MFQSRARFFHDQQGERHHSSIMDTSQLKCMIQCDVVLNGAVTGVFAADRLPTELPPTPFGFIANTDIHSKPGKHWCAFFCNFRGHVDFFDSYGRTPGQNSHHFRRWLEINANSVQTNRIQIQSDSSTLCGLYCILFLRQRLVGYTYQDFVNIFSASDLHFNDSFTADIMLNAYYECVGNELAYNQTCSALMTCV